MGLYVQIAASVCVLLYMRFMPILTHFNEINYAFSILCPLEAGLYIYT